MSIITDDMVEKAWDISLTPDMEDFAAMRTALEAVANDIIEVCALAAMGPLDATLTHPRTIDAIIRKIRSLKASEC